MRESHGQAYRASLLASWAPRPIWPQKEIHQAVQQVRVPPCREGRHAFDTVVVSEVDGHFRGRPLVASTCDTEPMQLGNSPRWVLTDICDASPISCGA